MALMLELALVFSTRGHEVMTHMELLFDAGCSLTQDCKAQCKVARQESHVRTTASSSANCRAAASAHISSEVMDFQATHSRYVANAPALKRVCFGSQRTTRAYIRT